VCARVDLKSIMSESKKLIIEIINVCMCACVRECVCLYLGRKWLSFK